jgi:hypothetical protein
MVTAAPLTAIPTGVLVTVSVVPFVATDADAVMLVAPVESILAAFKVMEATPLAFVNAVAEVGVNVTSELVSAKVTTVPCTSAPLASLSVAVAVTGVPKVTTFEGMLKIRELRSVVVVPVPVPVPVLVAVVSSPLPHPLRQQKRAEQISSSSIVRENFASVDFTILFSLFLMDR